MNDKQKRVAIAELAGYKKPYYTPRNWNGHPVEDLVGEIEPGCRELISDCLTDLNLTFLAWQKLSKHEQRIFTHVLIAIVVGKPLKDLPGSQDKINGPAAAIAINATAAQRTDALLITIGKLKLQPDYVQDFAEQSKDIPWTKISKS